jgi:CRISPR system Cascade subunit CasE
MYLSKVTVGWHWAKNPYELHRALWQMFPDRPEAERDFLFRVEQTQFRLHAQVLMQSMTEPQTSKAAQLSACKPIQFSIPEASVLRFRLRANPIKTIKDAKGRLNKKGELKSCRVPLVKEVDQHAWLVRKFDGIAELKTVQIVTEAPLYFYKNKDRDKNTEKSNNRQGGKINTVCYDGILTVTDSESFERLLLSGIGAGKSFGCGLLSIARV